MTMLPFNLLFPDVARDEARALLVRWPHGGLPVDSYVLVEHYCAEPGCDCRRVLLGVIRASTRAHVATLSYDFGAPGRHGVGGRPGVASLDSKNPQSELAPELLGFFQETCLSDRLYTSRLEVHYALWRAVVEDPRHPLHGKLKAAARPRS